MPRFLLTAAALGLAAVSADPMMSYPEFCTKFSKSASASAASIYKENLEIIEKHNGRFAEGLSSYKMGYNHLTDERSGPLGRAAPSAAQAERLAMPRLHKSAVKVADLPDSVDWRDSGVVTAVKNQGQCGSCWAFATTATVESHIALETGLLFDLSPQQLVSCAPNDDHCGGFGGCMGSIPEVAYDYLIGAGGYAEEWSLPYISYFGTTNGTCPDSPSLKAGISDYVKIEENNAADVMEALATVGPLAINVDASNWHTYESGIFDSCSYESMDLDHVVVLVGYGTDEELGDYWLVRNSWSPTFGEAGYIRLKRDPVDATPCGVDETPQDGTGCEGDATQYPCGQCGVVFDVSYPTGAFVV
ncbi:hypothetical protein TeGR_g8578 [Tetraparma gracilis]|uniref:Peptidase C1A papain C-terminal domain-containing protein n=1 Tax=Tetraparma gracilis TaxID=2962635 RepID=A0ABQ6MYZ6_9STRA|nr:hypothetical protein TeGR_g8578 [Tetraparma gracilis]